MADGCRAREVEREGRLTHRRTRGDDDHLPAVQAVGELVELLEARRNARHRPVAAAGCLDLFERGIDRDLQRHVVFGSLGSGDRVDLCLGVVDDVGGVALSVVTELHDAGARIDQTAQDRPLRHDARVVAGVRRSGDDRGERMQIVGAAGATQLPRLDELVGDGDDVRRLAVRVERQDRLEDELVLGDVEVGALERLDHIGDGILREEHSTQRALLGERVVRGCALWRTLAPEALL